MVHLVVTAQNVFALSYLVTDEDGRGTKLKKRLKLRGQVREARAVANSRAGVGG